MKAGIITYHRALNYGSALQAFALNHYLWKQGVEAFTIDYSSEGQRNTYTFYEQGHGIMTFARNVQTWLFRKSLKKKRQRFDEFISQKIPLVGTSVFEDEKEQQAYDFFICGSDQIWNGNTIDFTPHYLLSFVKDDGKCNSYAPSIGTLQQTEGTKELYRKYLRRFKNLSVREKSGAEYLSEQIDRKVEMVLDPVFLLEADEWRQVASLSCQPKGEYVLCYFIGDIAGMRDFAVKLGRQLGYKVYVILMNLRDLLCPPRIPLYDAGPAEFVNLLDGAKCVCTNSFHAMSFSVILQKDFWVFVNDKQVSSTETRPQTRILDLAASLGLENRVLDPQICNAVDMTERIDYSKIEGKLQALKQSSKAYLHKIITP